MKIRLTPEIRLSFDDSLAKGNLVLDLLARLKNDREADVLLPVGQMVSGREKVEVVAAAEEEEDPVEEEEEEEEVKKVELAAAGSGYSKSTAAVRTASGRGRRMGGPGRRHK